MGTNSYTTHIHMSMHMYMNMSMHIHMSMHMSHEYAYVTCICHMPRVHLLVCSFGSIEGNGRRRQTAVSSDFLAVSAVATAARSALVKGGGVQGRCPDAAPVRRASIHPSFSRPACGAGGGRGGGGRGAHPGCPLCGRGPPFFGGSFVCLCNQPARGNTASTQPVLDQQPTPPPGCCNAAVAHSGTRQQAREATRFCSKQDDPAVVGSGRKACACWKRQREFRVY